MSNEIVPYANEIIFYTTPEGNIRVEVIYSEESFWLSQKKRLPGLRSLSPSGLQTLVLRQRTKTPAWRLSSRFSK